MLNAKKGRLLISEPTLTDPVFFKSVVLLTHHSSDESIGLVLNHPTKIHLNEILNKKYLYFTGKNSTSFIKILSNDVVILKNNLSYCVNSACIACGFTQKIKIWLQGASNLYFRRNGHRSPLHY